MEFVIEGCNGFVEVIVDGGIGFYIFNWGQFDLQDVQLFDFCFGEYFFQVCDCNGCFFENIFVWVEDWCFLCFLDCIIFILDNDGVNEEFIIFCVNEFLDNYLQIFNCWGQLVFEVNNYDNIWNGVIQDGVLLLEGLYYYVLDYIDLEGNFCQQ